MSLTVADDDGATSVVTLPVQVTARLHSAYAGTTSKSIKKGGTTQQWSADVAVTVHGVDERPIAGATVSAAWSGAVVKNATCVTDVSGTCVLKSGTLSYSRSTVTLDVTAIVAPDGTYDGTSNHDTSGTRMSAVTLIRP